MKTRYRKYTKEYMSYLYFLHTKCRYLHNECKYWHPRYFKKLLKCGFFGFWHHSDWDYTKNKREKRLLNNYYNHILGIKD